MQRLYSMFPRHGPGVGLLVLRLGLILALAMMDCRAATPLGTFSVLASVLVSAGLLLGFLTPIAVSLAILCGLYGIFALSMNCAAEAMLIVMNSVAIFLLGPGGYSVDALIYGRKVVDFPSDDR